MISRASPTASLKHQEGLEFLKKGLLDDALRSLGEALAREETSERWNDWASAEFLSSCAVEAEHGFRRALELAPGDAQASANLGFLLMQQHRMSEALVYLQRAAGTEGAPDQQTASAALDTCRQHLRNWFAEFGSQLAAEPPPLEQIPRWPLHLYALRLAHFGQIRDAVEMVHFNRHFQPRDVALAKLQACLETMLANPGLPDRPTRESLAS